MPSFLICRFENASYIQLRHFPTLLTPKGEPSMNEEALNQMLDNETGNPARVEILLLVKELKHSFFCYEFL